MKSITVKIHPLVLAALIAVGIPAIAIAAGTILQPPVTVSGTSSRPLLLATNIGSGAALQGLSALGRGVLGQTKSNTANSLDSGIGGVTGQDLSKTNAFNSGVRGFSDKGSGVYGVASSGTGVIAQTLSGPAAILAIGNSALTGPNPGDTVAIDAEGNTGLSGIGVFGSGLVGLEGAGACEEPANCDGEGLGVDAIGETGLVAIGYGGFSGEGTGLFAESPSCSDCFQTGIALSAYSGDAVGAFVQTQATPSTGFTPPPAMIIQDNGGPALIVTTNGVGDIASIDSSGNMILKGGLTQNGTPLTATRGLDGRTVGTYQPRESLPTVEDFGEAQLTNGQSYVSFDSSFRNIIDPSSRYLVFITPGGDSKSLFVEQKSASGFVVREAEGGQSTILFDYRVVARPLHSAATRLPTVTDRSPRIAPTIFLNAHRTEQRAKVLYERIHTLSHHPR